MSHFYIIQTFIELLIITSTLSSSFSSKEIQWFYSIEYIKQSKSLIVGARDHVLVLDPKSLYVKNKIVDEAEEEDRNKCHNSPESCHNFFVVISEFKTGEKVIICGTNAFNPKCYQVKIKYLSQIKKFYNPMKNSLYMAPIDPHKIDACTYISVNGKGKNERDYYYGGTFEGTWHKVISNGKLFTNVADPSIFYQKTKFLSSFEDSDSVYFIFQEKIPSWILEEGYPDFYKFKMKLTIGQVGRICKNDQGSGVKFTTFLKANLVCPIVNKTTFTRMLSAHYLEEDQVIYAVMDNNGITVICAFDLSDIIKAFKSRKLRGGGKTEVNCKDSGKTSEGNYQIDKLVIGRELTKPQPGFSKIQVIKDNNGQLLVIVIRKRKLFYYVSLVNVYKFLCLVKEEDPGLYKEEDILSFKVYPPYIYLGTQLRVFNIYISVIDGSSGSSCLDIKHVNESTDQETGIFAFLFIFGLLLGVISGSFVEYRFKILATKMKRNLSTVSEGLSPERSIKTSLKEQVGQRN